ncbi:hypothetical protein vBPaePP1G_035 [Pseudomonas phage vB_PaeP_P1G]|uniref:Uncharacterized protein n=1 Tax=Pseudomonas phage vB_PaeP_P1G TaxID=3025372 RepID=A0AAF0BYF9_9CAUD|nr:hypothetical protein vBPaePP1G_035 [Pseudomonas phage vB_PaeP_P1G]
MHPSKALVEGAGERRGQGRPGRGEVKMRMDDYQGF